MIVVIISHYCRVVCGCAVVRVRCDVTVSSGDESGKLCCVCYEGAKDALFFPCRHIACCMECATALTTKSSSSHCPICRAAIRLVERVFIA